MSSARFHPAEPLGWLPAVSRWTPPNWSSALRRTRA